MRFLHELIRWYKLNHGIGKAMCAAGAEIMACPHCGDGTPIYRSAYDSGGTPLSFTVCLWCEGFIEYSPTLGRPHEPYASARDVRLERRQSKP
ncbi:hypothetical protein [Natronomonas sp. EA1]|uniref:hypothetical protein n=1 Tax=Natronomonas sp. EA1 TaxID=3421655 RepID=UPI003EB758C8